mmetsp:Transcript_16486/g.31344  ORF Transcript_16486/g.31344 Transcript_16486/m.31344 type:complete len:152 (+) Transcript_16486:141-596(+)|eukprot:scaffold4223_cov189-Amphora_coffeaeformis.AAC.28
MASETNNNNNIGLTAYFHRKTDDDDSDDDDKHDDGSTSGDSSSSSDDGDKGFREPTGDFSHLASVASVRSRMMSVRASQRAPSTTASSATPGTNKSSVTTVGSNDADGGNGAPQEKLPSMSIGTIVWGIGLALHVSTGRDHHGRSSSAAID